MKKSSVLAVCLGLCLCGCNDESGSSSIIDTNECDPACQIDEICKDNSCQKKCGENQKFVDGTCIDKDECSPKCASGSTCKNGECVPDTPQTCDPKCTNGTICKDGKCIPDTSQTCNPKCTNGTICKDGKCIPDTAETCDPKCDEGTICEAGECVPDPNYGPKCDPECEYGEECVDGKCVTLSGKCTPPCGDNEICIVDVCVSSSICTPKCDEQEICVNGKCLASNPEQCSDNISCESGICFEGKCLQDTTCPDGCSDGQICINGSCISGDGSTCTTECNANEICLQGLCVHGTTCTSDCPDNEICINGVCLSKGEKSCYPPCGSTQVCVNGICAETSECVPSCRLGYTCFNGVCLSSDGDCQISCDNGYASFGQDESGACICKPSPKCNPQCEKDEICINGICVASQSDECDKCNSNQLCINGICVNGSVCNPECGGGMVCVNNQCVYASSDRCNPECNGTDVCINGLCQDPNNGDGSCNPACPDDKVCKEGYCRDKDDGSCSTPCQNGKICRNGACVDGDDGSCRPDCNDGYFCQKGVCIQSCTTSEGIQCGSLCCEGKTPVCDNIEQTCLADCSNTQTRCGDELCCDNDTEFCIYGECKPKSTHKQCESAKDCPLDAYCEASVGMCISEDDVPKDCKRNTETYPFDAELLWNWPKDLTNGSAPGKSNWYDSVDSYNVMATPIVVNLTDDNGDGKINENDIPEIVFPTFRSKSPNSQTCMYCGVSSIRAVTTTADGKLIELAASSELYHGEEDLGAADIDGDGHVEIIAGSPSEIHALRLVEDKTSKTGYKWDTPYTLKVNSSTSLSALRPYASLADLEGDGVVDIITAYGVAIIKDGKMQWKNDKCHVSLGSHTAANLDGDEQGTLEIIGSGAIYDANCNKLTTSGSGFVSVANLLDDSKDAKETGELVPEIAVVGGSAFSFYKIYKKNGVWSTKQIWKQALPVNKKHHSYISDCKNGTEGHCFAAGGPPVIADFNGDQIPDVGVATRYYYIVFSNDGTPNGGQVLWADGGTQDVSSAVTGSSVFDFQGDGVAEILYADELNLYVYDGNGTTTDADNDGYNDPAFIIGRTQADALKFIHSSGTAYEYPIVVDMNNDGKSEIVHSSNHYSGLVNPFSKTKGTGVSVYKDTQNRWVRTRRIWNQHDYHVTNINEDGTVPLHETPNWTMPNLNNFRQNVQPSAINAAPNMKPKVLSYGIGACPDTVTLVARFNNIGGLGTTDPITVTFYARTPDNQQIVIGSKKYEATLIPGAPVTIPFEWNFTSLDGMVAFDPYKQVQVYYEIDTPDETHPDGVIIECKEDDNFSDSIAVSCPPPSIN